MTSCGDINLRDYFDGQLQFDILKQAISTYKKLQTSTTNYIDAFLALGVPDWRLDQFPLLYQQLISNPDYLTDNGLSEEQQGQLQQYTEKIKALCKELACFNIDACLNQSDFHDNNILFDKKSKTIAFIDLGETAIHHPLFSLKACLEVVKNR